MSRDPYFDVKAEVESSLVSATSLHSSYHRILLTLPPEAHETSDELAWAHSELKATLSALTADVSELDEAVAVLEKDIRKSGNSRFGVSQDEVCRRRAWVQNVQAELHKMRTTSTSPQRQSSTLASRRLLQSAMPAFPPTRKQGQLTYHPLSQVHSPSSQTGQLDDDTEQFCQEQQSMIIDQQDRTLGTISGVVGVLREQASLIGREISEHNIMLEDLDEHIDRTDSRLSKANKKLNKFVARNKNSKSSWCILLLIIVLVCLLLAIILV